MTKRQAILVVVVNAAISLVISVSVFRVWGRFRFPPTSEAIDHSIFSADDEASLRHSWRGRDRRPGLKSPGFLAGCRHESVKVAII